MNAFEPVRFWPAKRGTSRVGRQLINYGIYDQSGAKIKPWPIMISYASRFYYMRLSPPKNAKLLDNKQYIFAGNFEGNFGHFLTETLPCLAAAMDLKKQFPDATLLFYKSARPLEKIMASAGAFLPFIQDHFGIDAGEIEFIDEPLHISQCAVAPSPFLAKSSYAPAFADTIRKHLSFSAKTPDRRLYISRAKWPYRTRVNDEMKIQNRFEKNGFEPVFLEELNLNEQFELIQSAKQIIGPQGSGLHWSLYAPNLTSIVSLGRPSKLQRGICSLHGQKYVEVTGTRKSIKDRRDRLFDDSQLQSAVDIANHELGL